MLPYQNQGMPNPAVEAMLSGAQAPQQGMPNPAIEAMMSGASGPPPRGMPNPAVAAQLSGGGGMYFAEGGAVPDDDGDYDGDTADTAAPAGAGDMSAAMDAVNKSLIYGRQKFGLPGHGIQRLSDQSSQNTDQSPIDSEDSDTDSGQGDTVSMNFDDGGAVPADAGDDQFAGSPLPPESESPPPVGMNSTDDNSGAAPVMGVPDDNSGAAPVMPMDQNAQDGSEQALRYLQGEWAAPVMPMDQNAQDGSEQALRYLQGEGATPVVGGDPTAAVLNAYNEGGPEGGFGVLQGLRKMWNALAGHAFVANEGVNGKAPNPQAAALGATKAFAQLPTGENVGFTPTPDGYIATVKDASGVNRVQLSQQQFAQAMDPRGHGQWDHMVEKGPLQTLQQIAAKYGGQTGKAQFGRPGSENFTAPKSAIPEGNEGPKTGYDEQATRELGPNDAFYPPGKNSAFRRDVTLLRSPSYQAMMEKQGKTPIRTKDGYITGWKGGTNLGGDQQANVNIRTGDRVKTFQNGNMTADTGEDQDPRVRAAKLRAEAVTEAAKTRGEIEKTKQTALSDRAEKGRQSRSDINQAKLNSAAELQARRLDAAGQSEAAKELRSRIAAGQITNDNIDAERAKTFNQPQYRRQTGQPQQAPQQSGGGQQAPQIPAAQMQQAQAWARANPNDPRAQKIMKLLGQ